jgi:hypothetical protein
MKVAELPRKSLRKIASVDQLETYAAFTERKGKLFLPLQNGIPILAADHAEHDQDLAEPVL